MEPHPSAPGHGDGRRRAQTFLWPLLLTLPLFFLLIALAAGPDSWVGALVERGFAPLCHQIPERSLLWGQPLAVCTRCAGFYAGLALAGILGFAAAAAGWRKTVPGGLVIAGLVPLAVDGTANFAGLWSSPPAVRALIGLLAALPLALILVGRHEAE